MIFDVVVSLSLLLHFQPSNTVATQYPPTAAVISQRVIYTFHPTQKTWNEAREICEDRMGQLVKLESTSQEEELLYLDSHTYNNSMQNQGIDLWTGNHVNSTSSELVYQDCLTSTTNVAQTTTPAPNQACLSFKIPMSVGFSYSYEACSTPRAFTCQRTIGDCWFRPYEDYTVIGDSTHVILNGTETVNCALECRNGIDGTGNECWAFSYYNNYHRCVLHFLGETQFGKAPSVAYLLGDNDYLLQQAGTTLYLRICFEGEVDEEPYDDYTDTSSDPDFPNQACSKTDPDPADQLCFCESTEDPPIPTPIPVVDKIEELIRELTVEPSNTSAALRKKISAEDNRPSAVGVGYMGAGLMGFVFGGLFLLDAHVVIEGIAQIVKLIKGTA